MRSRVLFEYRVSNSTSRIQAGLRVVRCDVVQPVLVPTCSDACQLHARSVCCVSIRWLPARGLFVAARPKDHYRPFRATESRSHLPMSAASTLMSDRTQRNVRAPFQDTQGIRPSNLDLTFGKDLRRDRGFHATQISYRLNGNTLMSRQELRSPAG